MFCLLVVLVKLSVLAKWLAWKTPLRKPNRGEGIISKKPRPKSAYVFLGLFYCFTVLLYGCVVPCPAWYTLYGTMARYSLFVLKVPLNTKQTNRSTGLEAMSSLFESWWCGSTLTCSFQWKCLFFSSAGNYVVIIVFVLLCVLVDYIQRWVNCIVCNVLFSHKVVLSCFIFFWFMCPCCVRKISSIHQLVIFHADLLCCWIFWAFLMFV